MDASCISYARFIKVSTIFNPAQVLSYAITSVAVTIVALCYAELAAAIPSTGAAYSYTYHYFGELFAWIVGWSLLLEYVTVIPKSICDYECVIYL